MRLLTQLNIGRRLMWWPPWAIHARIVGVWRGADEWCNESIAFDILPLGCLIVFWRPRLRTWPCDSCWAQMSHEQQSDYMPCGWLHGGRVHHNAHHHVGMPSPDADGWLTLPTLERG